VGYKEVCPNPWHYFGFLWYINVPYSKDDLHQKQLENDLRLFIAKEFAPLSFVEHRFLGG
jgi:hypothetical protein